MTALKQNGSANDISINSSGDFEIVEGLDAYANIIEDTMRTILGELQLNIEAGVDYFGTVFSSINAVPMWKSKVSELVMSFDFVLSVDEIDAQIINDFRTMKYTMTVTTDLGQLTVSQ